MLFFFFAKDMQQTETSIITSTAMEIDHIDDDTVNEFCMPTTSSKLPLILQGEFFEVTAKSTDKKIIAQCKNCPKIISGSRTSTGNFVSHYNVSYVFLCFLYFCWFLFLYIS